MKTRNLFCAAAFLSLLLSVPVYAGDVQTPTIVPPPPPSATILPGDNPGDGAPVPQSETAADLLIQMLLGMLSF